jgi:predicted nucleic acid-binding protein
MGQPIYLAVPIFYRYGVQEYLLHLQSVVSEVVPFTMDAADRQAKIRGSLGLPTADAIHLASAAQAGTHLFLTITKG